MKYKTLLFDGDETLLDFRASEASALQSTFSKYAPGAEDTLTSAFHRINEQLWRDYENELIPREDIYTLRFPNTFRACGLPTPDLNIIDFYQDRLSSGHDLIPGALETIKSLYGKYTMRMITNGKKSTQLRRLADSGLSKYFDGVFISEDLGVQKPSPAFFDKVFETTRDDRQTSLIIGDSLSSDIQGGFNAGVDTCWFNPKGKLNTGDKPTYEIAKLTELLDILL